VYVPLHGISLPRQHSYMAISNGIFCLDDADERCGRLLVIKHSRSPPHGQRLIPVLVSH
jgi:hypothetical protein